MPNYDIEHRGGMYPAFEIIDRWADIHNCNIKFSVRRYGEQNTNAVVTTQHTDDKQQDTDKDKAVIDDA